MNQLELLSTIVALKKQLEVYNMIKVCCSTCEHLRGDKCQEYQATPPPDWHTGPIDCAKWQYDSIPF